MDINKFLSLFIIFYICLEKYVNARYLSNCILSGIDGSRKIKRLKSVFDFESNTAIYHIKFCGKDHVERHVCFATRINHEKLTTKKDCSTVTDIKLWAKLIATLKGEMAVTPYDRETYEHIYGGSNDHFHCHNKFYVIHGELTKEQLQKIVSESASLSTEQCITRNSCMQEFVGSKCHKIRLDCNWHDQCRTAKKEKLKKKIKHLT